MDIGHDFPFTLKRDFRENNINIIGFAKVENSKRDKN